jgi:hypothetical protein
MFEDANLFNFIYNSLKLINNYLNSPTNLIVSSSIPIDHSLKSEGKVLAICKALSATQYINPIGDLAFYNKDVFKNEGIDLYFLNTNNIFYTQFHNEFVPFLSILDVFMFNEKEKAKILLKQFILQ